MKVHLFNYAAPSLVRSDVMVCISKIIGHHFVGEPKDSTGILLTPIFNYKPGTLYMDEHSVLKTLHGGGVTVDHAVQLCFDPKTKCDA